MLFVDHPGTRHVSAFAGMRRQSSHNVAIRFQQPQVSAQRRDDLFAVVGEIGHRRDALMVGLMML